MQTPFPVGTVVDFADDVDSDCKPGRTQDDQFIVTSVNIGLGKPVYQINGDSEIEFYHEELVFVDTPSPTTLNADFDDLKDPNPNDGEDDGDGGDFYDGLEVDPEEGDAGDEAPKP